MATFLQFLEGWGDLVVTYLHEVFCLSHLVRHISFVPVRLQPNIVLLLEILDGKHEPLGRFDDLFPLKCLLVQEALVSECLAVVGDSDLVQTLDVVRDQLVGVFEVLYAHFVSK